MDTGIRYFIGVDKIWKPNTPILIRVIPHKWYPQAYRWVNTSVKENGSYKHTKKLVWIDVNYSLSELTPITLEEAGRHMLMEELDS